MSRTILYNPHALLPPQSEVSHNCQLRQRVHDRLLPQHQGHLIDKNFITGLFCMKTYIGCPSILLLHLSLLILLTALCQFFNKEDDDDENVRVPRLCCPKIRQFTAVWQGEVAYFSLPISFDLLYVGCIDQKEGANRSFLSRCVHFLPARRYASAGYRDRNVSVCPSVCLCVRPSRAGIVSKRRMLAAW